MRSATITITLGFFRRKVQKALRRRGVRSNNKLGTNKKSMKLIIVAKIALTVSFLSILFTLKPITMNNKHNAVTSVLWRKTEKENIGALARRPANSNRLRCLAPGDKN
jgi:hypothetical protein